MIYNRTANDVSTANLLRKKMQAGIALTNEETAAFERGACTITMLNRIESKQSELAGILSGYAYTVQIVNKQWAYTDIFKYADFARLLHNLDKLKQAFYIYHSTPETPTYIYGYKEANDIEKILADIETLISDMLERFRECNTFYCGEENPK